MKKWVIRYRRKIDRVHNRNFLGPHGEATTEPRARRFDSKREAEAHLADPMFGDWRELAKIVKVQA